MSTNTIALRDGHNRQQSITLTVQSPTVKFLYVTPGNVCSHAGLLVNSNLSSQLETQTWQFPQSPHCSLLASWGRDASPEKLKSQRTGRPRAQQQRREPTKSQQ